MKKKCSLWKTKVLYRVGRSTVLCRDIFHIIIWPFHIMTQCQEGPSRSTVYHKQVSSQSIWCATHVVISPEGEEELAVMFL